MSEWQTAAVSRKRKSPSKARSMVMRFGNGLCALLAWLVLPGKPLLKTMIDLSYSLYSPRWLGWIGFYNGTRADETAKVIKRANKIYKWVVDMVKSYPFTTVYVCSVATAVAIMEAITK
jgi:hypothetical protein